MISPMSVVKLIISITIIFSLGGCGGVKGEALEQAQYHHKLAYGHFFENHDSDAALQEVLKSLKLNPRSPDVHLLAGLIYSGRRDLLKAIQHYQSALELKPDFYKAKNNLGTVYLTLGNWVKAIEIFGDLITHDEYSTPAVGFNNLGWAYYKLDKLDEALRAFITASQLNPRLCPPHNNVGLIYLRRGDLERAERSLLRGLRQCPNYAEPHLHLGRIYTQRGDLVKAQKQWVQCKKLSSDNDLGLRCTRLLRERQQRLRP
jgi:Tfp pilus assembly protein PilF